jgi:hypothetical protein
MRSLFLEAIVPLPGGFSADGGDIAVKIAWPSQPPSVGTYRAARTRIGS